MLRFTAILSALAAASLLVIAQACPLGDCEGDITHAGRLDARYGQTGASPGNPDDIINLPTIQQAPYLVQHGPTRRADLITFPAQYERKSSRVAGVFVAYPPKNEAERHANPRGWNTRMGDFPNQGWHVIDPYIEDLVNAGYTEICFWFWSGAHTQPFNNPQALASRVMPWLTPETATPAMRATWPDFVRKWKARGVTFGYWLGGAYAPNFGTAEHPNHRFLTRSDFDYVGDTIKKIKDLGFDTVTLDALSSLINTRDMPPTIDLPPHAEAGPRDRGITLDLLRYLNDRSDLQGIRISTERLLPAGPMVAEAPTVVACASRRAARSIRFTVDTLPPLDVYNAVTPGSEVLALMVGDQWDRQEYEAFKARAESLGYRVGAVQAVLQAAGVVRTAQQIKRGTR